MFGHKLRAAAGEALAREERLLAAAGVGPADFARGGGEAEGTRRAARLPLAVELAPPGDGYRARFELPKGYYATVVMRELMKAEGDLPEDSGVGERSRVLPTPSRAPPRGGRRRAPCSPRRYLSSGREQA